MSHSRLPLLLQKKGSLLLFGSLTVFAYFFSMFFISGYRNEYPVIGVLIELFTIPMLLLLCVLLMLLFKHMIKEGFAITTLVSLLLVLSVIAAFFLIN